MSEGSSLPDLQGPGITWSDLQKTTPVEQKPAITAAVALHQQQTVSIAKCNTQSMSLHCALAAAQCIVIGPVCLFVSGSVTMIT